MHWALLGMVVLASLFAAIDASGSKPTANAVAQTSLVERLHGQADSVRLRIATCIAGYPNGDNGTTFHAAYPGAVAPSLVSALGCPGAPPAARPLWSGTEAIYAPVPIPGFSAWAYQNDGLGVRLSTSATSADPLFVNALAKLRQKYAANEASLAGGTFTLWIMQP